MFHTKLINDIYNKNVFSLFYKKLHQKNFIEAKAILNNLGKNIDNIDSKEELILNDIYLFKIVLTFHNSLVSLWEDIFNQKYSSSWIFLQDSLDALRTVNKLSLNNKKNKALKFFEKQLLTLERLYPYKIFASVAWEVSFYECSICKKDIDSFDCPHEIGELYNGKIAIAHAKEITQLNHVAMVENPSDKRCVVQYDDNSKQFKILQYLNKMLILNKLTPLTYYKIDETPRKLLNKDYIQLERNKKCFCGSNRKFKKCCINKKFIEEKHIELIINPEFKLW